MITIRKKRASAFLLSLLISSLHTISPADESSSDTPDRRPGWSAGLGAVYITQPYRGIDDRFIPLPFVVYRGPVFSILGPAIGIKIAEKAPVRVNAGLSWRFSGYDPDDSNYLRGMEERDDTLQAGAEMEIRLPRKFTLETEWNVDTLGKNNGYEIGASLRRAFPRGRFQIAPSIGWTYLSSNLANTYFGVRAAEARADRPAYAPGASGMFSLGLSVFYLPKQDISVFTSVRANFFDRDIRRSPVLSQDRETRMILGLMRNWRPKR